MEKPVTSHIGLRAFLLLCAMIFTALCTWQVQRLFWKLDLIERVDARIHAAATPPPSASELAGLPEGEIEYRRVTVSGRFDHADETLVQAVTERGPGFWVVTPLATADRGTILINRGFVPSDRRDPATRAEGQVSGETTVTGLLRLTEPDGAFLRSNDAAKGNWYSRDVKAIGESHGLTALYPHFIDADASANPGGFPVGGLTVVHFRNSHLVYALTWFSLAIMAFGAAILIPRFLRREG